MANDSKKDSTSPRLNSGHRATYEKLMRDPKPADLNFDKLISLLKALGARTSRKGKTSGSRYGVLLNGCVLTLHEPHPEKNTDKGAIESVRDFLIRAGVEIDDEN